MAKVTSLILDYKRKKCIHRVSHKQRHQKTKIETRKFRDNILLSEGADQTKGEVFFMLPRVLLEGGASKGCLGNGGLGLTVANFLVERDLTAGEGVLSRIVFPTGERFPTYGTKKNHLKGTRNNTFTLFGSFRLGRLRGRTLLQYRWKEVHDFHFPLLTCGILTCIPEPPLLLFVPLKYARTFLLLGICNHGPDGNK